MLATNWLVMFCTCTLNHDTLLPHQTTSGNGCQILLKHADMVDVVTMTKLVMTTCMHQSHKTLLSYSCRLADYEFSSNNNNIRLRIWMLVG